MHGFDTDNQCLRQHPHLCPDQHPFVPNPRPAMGTPAARRRRLVPPAVPGWSVQARNARTTWNGTSKICCANACSTCQRLQERWVRVHEEERRGRLTPPVELPQVAKPEPATALALASRPRQARTAGPICTAPETANARVKPVVPASPPPPPACKERTPVRPVRQCAPRPWPGAPTTPCGLPQSCSGTTKNLSQKCNGSGQCSAQTTQGCTYRCNSQGTDCDDTNYCSPNPCLNGGSCANTTKHIHVYLHRWMGRSHLRDQAIRGAWHGSSRLHGFELCQRRQLRRLAR